MSKTPRKPINGRLRCSACGKQKPLENFYGKVYKQSRCILCYNAAYGAYYRRALREARHA